MHSYLCILMTISGRYRLLIQILFVSRFSSASIHARSFQYFNLFVAVSYLFLSSNIVNISLSTNNCPLRTSGSSSVSWRRFSSSNRYSHIAKYSLTNKFNIAISSLSGNRMMESVCTVKVFLYFLFF